MSYLGDNRAVTIDRRVSPDPGGPKATAFEAILGHDPELLASIRMAARFASTRLPILLLAETGTGKELFARAIHEHSERRRAPFVPLNCGALAPTLLESELFGHAPGAFTGAQRAGSPGKLAAADGGTLFLDEIAEMPDSLQATLLRVLEDGSYYRVGESRARRSDFRLVCATCRDLPGIVASGRFRRDLFFRIHAACITLPPLRDRRDRMELARGLLSGLAEQSGVPCPALSDDALAWIERHPFPGNVRELKNALAHALVMAEGARIIDASCFPKVVLWEPPRPANAGGSPAETSPTGVTETGAPETPSGSTSGNWIPPVSGVRRRDDILHEAMSAALRDCAGNVSAAARRLGVARSTLYRHLPELSKG